MALKVSVFIGMSLDGFIAREDGSLDWLDKASQSFPEGEDAGYKVFFDSIDTVVMGRKTFEQVLSFGPWPYENKKVIVLSRKKMIIPASIAKTVSHSSESSVKLYKRLETEGADHLYVDGGTTIQRFLAESLIDSITITTIPLIIGSGIPLFTRTDKDILLRLVSSRTYDYGFVQSTYEFLK